MNMPRSLGLHGIHHDHAQPLVTVVLALIFLGEGIGLIEGCGIVLAIGAAVALSQETRKTVGSQGQA